MRTPAQPAAGGSFCSPLVASSGLVATGTGLTINGAYSDDNLRLRFHLGSGVAGCLPRNDCLLPCKFPYYSSYAYWNPWGSLVGYSNGYDSRPVLGYGYIDPYLFTGPTTAPPAPPVREPTTLEKADFALSQGQGREAVRLYRQYLVNSPENAEAMRSLALALMIDRQVRQGIAVMLLAYEQDPALAADPIASGVFKDGRAGLRYLLLSATRYANRVKSASGWLTIAILLQAEDRDDQARRMLERADAAGLSPRVGSSLGAALTN